MWRATVYTIALVVGICVGAGNLAAADWQWPAQITIAGFSVVGVRGTVNPDGSGTAAGLLQIRGLAAQRISLSRAANGEITGSTTINAKLSGVEVQGAFILSAAGLGGKGTVQAAPKPVTDAAIQVDTEGRFAGIGRVILGSIGVPVKFSVAGGLLSYGGTTAVHPQVDTPLAFYKFDGSLDVAGGSGKIDVTARGRVQRTGKLANQVTTHAAPGVTVSPLDGRGSVNVGGVNVTFEFF